MTLNNEEQLQGSCHYCGGAIHICEVVCDRCCDDLDKELEYEDYLNNLSDKE